MAREMGDQAGVARGLNSLGVAALALGMLSESERYLEESLAICVEIGDREGASRALNNLGLRATQMEASPEAKRRYQEALMIDKEIGNQRGLALHLTNLGEAAIALGETEEARGYLREALSVANAIGAEPWILGTLPWFAQLAGQEANVEQALELLGMALNHPATTTEAKADAERVLSALRAAWPPEIVEAGLEKGRQMSLAAAVAQILRADVV